MVCWQTPFCQPCPIAWIVGAVQINRLARRHVSGYHRDRMPAPRTRQPHRPIEYRDPQNRVWSVSLLAVLRVVSPTIDGPNRFLVLRFEHEGQQRFRRWSGETDWREPATLQQLFETTDPPSGMGAAPAESVALWVRLVASMGPDELDSFEERTFKAWGAASLGGLRGAIRHRRQQLVR